MTITAQFETGRTYSCRSVCDHECIFSFTVLERTRHFITIKGHGRITRRKVFKAPYDAAEKCYPLGVYSMCPVLSADRGEA